MAKTSLDDIFDNLALRVTSEVPATNYLVKVEDLDTVKQDVKEFFTALGDNVIKDEKSKKAWRTKVASL